LHNMQEGQPRAFGSAADLKGPTTLPDVSSPSLTPEQSSTLAPALLR
jgi:hypothetical protein